MLKMTQSEIVEMLSSRASSCSASWIVRMCVSPTYL